MARALKWTWLHRIGTRRSRGGAMRPPIVASRDLPPIDPATLLALPRSPEPMPEEALAFARGAASRVRSATGRRAGDTLSIVDGADLRAMLERIEQANRRRTALNQAAQARARIVEQLAAGKAAQGCRPSLQLVDGHQVPTEKSPMDEPDIERAMEQALASALGTLKQISELSKR